MILSFPRIAPTPGWAWRAAPVLALCWLMDLGPQPNATWAQSNGGADGAIDVYRVGRLWTGEGAPLDDAVLVVANGRVQAMGPRDSVEIPPRSRVHDHPHHVVIPGLILAESSVGAPADNDYSVTPHLRVVDALDLFADQRRLLSAGVTTVQVAPGAQRILPGQGAVVKLYGEMDARVLRETERLRLILTSAAWNPPTIYEPPVGAVSEDRPLEPTRPQLANSLADAVAGLRALFRAARAPSPESSDSDAEILATLDELLRGQRALRVTARTAAEIRAAARLLHDHSLTGLLVDPRALTAWETADQAGFEVFDGFVLMPPSRPDAVVNVPVPAREAPREDEFWETARWLADRGYWDRVALGGVNENEVADLLLLAAMLQRGGFSHAEILQSLTRNAAALLGVSERVGTLLPGRDADFVILTADPFNRGAQVLATYVNGEVAYQSDHPAAGRDRPIVIRAGAVHTSHGALADAAVVVSGGSIAAVGSEVSVPVDAEVFVFPDGVIVPGAIDLQTELGLGGVLRDRIELHVELANLIVSEDEAVRYVREAGVTTVLVGSTRLPSPMMAIKLSDRPRVIRDPVALRFEVSGNLTTAEATLRRTLAQGKAYADQWIKYEADLAEYQRALAAYEASQKTDATPPAENSTDSNQEPPAGENRSGAGTGADASQETTENQQDPPANADPKKPTEPTLPRMVANMEPYRLLFAGKLPLMIVAQQANAIEVAVRIAADEFKLPTIIAGADEADLALDSLRRQGVSVAMGPGLIARRGERSVNLPQQLATAGVPFGFQSGATTGAARLPASISFATYRGLGTFDALRGWAESPAQFLQLGRIGKLEAGYEADLVVLSGPPFDLGTEVLAVMIDGVWVFQKESQR